MASRSKAVTSSCKFQCRTVIRARSKSMVSTVFPIPEHGHAGRIFLPCQLLPRLGCRSSVCSLPDIRIWAHDCRTICLCLRIIRRSRPFLYPPVRVPGKKQVLILVFLPDQGTVPPAKTSPLYSMSPAVFHPQPCHADDSAGNDAEYVCAAYGSFVLYAERTSDFCRKTTNHQIFRLYNTRLPTKKPTLFHRRPSPASSNKSGHSRIFSHVSLCVCCQWSQIF